jgi:hypothetical protein
VDLQFSDYDPHVRQRSYDNQPFSTPDNPYINSLRAIADNLHSIGTNFKASCDTNDDNRTRKDLVKPGWSAEEVYFGIRRGVSPPTSGESFEDTPVDLEVIYDLRGL